MTNLTPANPDTLDVETANIGKQTVVPLYEEELSIAKRVVETARVQVSRVTHDRQQIVDELLQCEKVEVERVPMNQSIEAMPSIRQEDDVTIIPVVEEVLTVERRLVLKEEVHIRRIKQTERHRESVTLRKQEAQISRMPIERANGPGDGTQINASNLEKENL